MAKKKSKRAAKKYYVLLKGSKEVAVFTGRQPRQAALKAASRGFTEIKLRERGRRNQDGTYSIHLFKGGRKQVKAPEDGPDWLPDKVWKATVSKKGVDRVKKV